MSIKETGSITFWAKHEHPDWASNSNGYDFGSFTGEGITVKMTKHPNRSVTFDIDGPFAKSFHLESAMPDCGPKGLFVAITWENKSLNLYLNGQLVETVSANDA
jgi:hypothetical protein